MNPSGGSIDAAWLYTAGATDGVSDTVAVSDSLGNVATATVTVSAAGPPRATKVTGTCGSGPRGESTVLLPVGDARPRLDPASPHPATVAVSDGGLARVRAEPTTVRAHAIDSALAGATSAGALHEPEAGVGLTIARELAVLFNALLFDRVEVFFLKGLGAQPGDRVLLD